MTDDRDLVTRLREYRMDVDSPDVVAEAADEIELLRALAAAEKPVKKRAGLDPLGILSDEQYQRLHDDLDKMTRQRRRGAGEAANLWIS
jgi:hypothetical protein